MTNSEAREMARGLVRGSIIEDAAAQFIAQVLKEAHDSRVKPMRDRIEELEAELLETQDRSNAFATKEYYTEMRAERAEAKLAKLRTFLDELWDSQSYDARELHDLLKELEGDTP